MLKYFKDAKNAKHELKHGCNGLKTKMAEFVGKGLT